MASMLQEYLEFLCTPTGISILYVCFSKTVERKQLISTSYGGDTLPLCGPTGPSVGQPRPRQERPECRGSLTQVHSLSVYHQAKGICGLYSGFN